MPSPVSTQSNCVILRVPEVQLRIQFITEVLNWKMGPLMKSGVLRLWGKMIRKWKGMISSCKSLMTTCSLELTRRRQIKMVHVSSGPLVENRLTRSGNRISPLTVWETLSTSKVLGKFLPRLRHLISLSNGLVHFRTSRIAKRIS